MKHRAYDTMGQSFALDEKQLIANEQKWINDGLDPDCENQRTIQEKIIKLYELIEKKTIKNIEMKKNNDILRAQAQAYISIIDKIQKTSQNTYQDQRGRQVNQFENKKAHQTFQKEEGNEGEGKMDINIYEGRKSSEFNQLSNCDTSPSINSSQNLIIHKRNSGNFARYNYEERVSYQKQTNCKANVNNDCPVQSQTKAFSPRPSIDNNMKKLSSPNKSFLKKGSTPNINTGNLASVDIESLWNDTKSPSKITTQSKNKIGTAPSLKDPPRFNYNINQKVKK